jgi:hypothetical protein
LKHRTSRANYAQILPFPNKTQWNLF